MKSHSILHWPDVTVVIPARNAESTILKTFEGVRNQKYPIRQVIFVDNVSTDNTIPLAVQYAAEHPTFPLRIIKNRKNIMVAGSFNKAIRIAQTPYVVAMHGDCRFASKNDLRKLVAPIARDSQVVATYGFNETPLWVWKQYSFWEKCLMAIHVGKSTPGLVGKIDCYNKDALLSVGGYDDILYADYGGEDADLHIRLSQKGKIVMTQAKTLHLHYLDKNFSLFDWIRKKKATARTYGRLLRVQGWRLGIKGVAAFLMKPVLALSIFVPGLSVPAIFIMIFFIAWYYQKIFTYKETLFDLRIILLPVVAVFLLYYETFWIIMAFLEGVKRQSYGNV